MSNNPKRDAAILRLRKIMGERTWGSEEEMKTAMELAQKIMRQYNISMSVIEHEEIICEQRSADGGKKRKRRGYMDRVAWRIARFTETKFWRSHDFIRKTGFTYDFFGYPSDVELALYFFETTKRYIDNATEKYNGSPDYLYELTESYPPIKSRQLLHAYKTGCSMGVCEVFDDLYNEKLEEVAQLQEAVTETGLMVIKDKVIERDFEKTGISLTSRPGLSSKVSSTAGYHAGIIEGRKFKPRTGVGGGGSREHLLR